MKIKELNGIVTSQHGGAMAWTVVYSRTANKDISPTATFEYIAKNYGDMEIKRMFPYYDSFNANAVLVIEVEGEE